MTKGEAIALAESRFWETMSQEDRAIFQLCEDRLCMPFKVFHEAVEAVLGRAVWTHEFAHRDALKRELFGDKPAPTMEEILDLIPAEKRILVKMEGSEGHEE